MREKEERRGGESKRDRESASFCSFTSSSHYVQHRKRYITDIGT
ncbi:Uncharacterized protein TCM_046771 [Theobroma cacao]|uniref:Uncharacterized protein n=1 Tax=Theobroma cacao TaxID=3641 RepID=A0A061EN75_THECC|nr:Uncharacterized protein TCM_046771 [Theobroma cacao]